MHSLTGERSLPSMGAGDSSTMVRQLQSVQWLGSDTHSVGRTKDPKPKPKPRRTPTPNMVTAMFCCDLGQRACVA